MRFLIIIFCLIALAACSDDANRAHLVDQGDASTTVDTGIDSGSVDAAESEPDAADAPDSEDCVCATTSVCCDGCNPINQGGACDDGLECTLETTCQADGLCAGAAGSVCDAQLTDPQCQSVTCDEAAGCGVVQNVREGFACDDGNEQTYNDVCQGETCVGAACECAGESACCDGCNVIAEDGAACDDGTAETDRDTCQQGQCVGEVCECAPGDACCDGCHWTPGVVCESQINTECSNDSGCAPRIDTFERVRICEPVRDDFRCGLEWGAWEFISDESCPGNKFCTVNDDFTQLICRIDVSCG